MIDKHQLKREAQIVQKKINVIKGTPIQVRKLAAWLGVHVMTAEDRLERFLKLGWVRKEPMSDKKSQWYWIGVKDE